jgi:hypothetical protein
MKNIYKNDLYIIILFHFKGEDTTMKFSLTPCPGEKGFQQWKDAISVATRMPGGLLPSIRHKVLNCFVNLIFCVYFFLLSFGYH